MNQTIRRGDYLQVDCVQPQVVVDEKRKKANQEPNPNIYTDQVCVSSTIEMFRIPKVIPTTDNYAISNLRDQLIQLKNDVPNKPQNQKTIQQINDLFLELTNIETLDKVEVDLKPFQQTTKSQNKFPPPKDYTLVLPIDTSIEKRIKRLQTLQYPYLILSQLLTSILLGERQQLFDINRTNQKQQNKTIIRNQDLINISNRYQKIESTIDGFSSLTQRINKDQSIHTNAIGFVEKLQTVTDNHYQIQEQLNQNIALATKLQQNWNQNKIIFNSTISTLKEKLAKLKK